MKLLTITTLLFISMNVNAQLSFSGGYSQTYHSPTAGIAIAVNPSNFSIGTFALVHLTRASHTPQTVGFTAGYNIGNVRLFTSYAYQTVGPEEKEFFNNGWKPGYGVMYRFYYKERRLQSFTFQRTGKDWLLSYAFDIDGKEF